MARKRKKIDVGGIRNEVKHLKDGLGRPVDPGIVEAVTILNACSFTTRSSCEGHPRVVHSEKYRPSLTPWVRVECESGDELHMLVGLLQRFYSGHAAPSHYALLVLELLKDEKILVNIVNAGADVLKKYPTEDEDELVAGCKGEWQAFVDFYRELLREYGAAGVDP